MNNATHVLLFSVIDRLVRDGRIEAHRLVALIFISRDQGDIGADNAAHEAAVRVEVSVLHDLANDVALACKSRQ